MIAYVQLRSWWTIPAKFPLTSHHGVFGARVNPWMPPKVVFYRSGDVNYRNELLLQETNLDPHYDIW